jgi:uncharacterized zinc-type alcohol dehydrogenase-like protein
MSDHASHKHPHVKAYGVGESSAPLALRDIPRRAPTAEDVVIDILYCGVCHSDVHQARDEWHNTVWPCVPGHEIVGTVSRVGEHVTKFKAGDTVGVGCMVARATRTTARTASSRRTTAR